MIIDYTGKTVFIGIDVHKKTYSVACIFEGQIVKRDKIKASPQGLLDYLHKYFPGGTIITAYEAGFSGLTLHRFLAANGINNSVIHAASIEISARDRIKTDKRDAFKIATQLAAGRLKCIHILDEKREGYRNITRLRESFVCRRKAVGNQLKSLLFQHGLIAPDDDRKVSEKWIKVVLAYNVDEDLKYCIDVLSQQWLDFAEKIKKIEKKLANQAEQDGPIETIYRSAPGIGPINARILANELGDMRQFNNAKSLSSFTGLTPCEYSSGEHVRQGHISRQGRPLLRKTLVQSAWIAIKMDKSLREIFERLAKRSGVKRAIIAIARRLIGRIRACFQTGELYRIEK